MRGIGMIAAVVMSMGLFVGCGGTLEETPVPSVPGDEVGALYACPIDRPCPGTTTCVNGMCRDCQAQPRFCQRSMGNDAAGVTQAIARPPTDPTQPQPLPYCWNLAGRGCSAPGTQAQCTDGTYSDYTCTCGTDYKYYCMQVR